MSAIDISLDVTAALKARLATITPANGYHTDAGNRIYVHRRNIDQQNLPCINIYEDEDTVFEQKDTEVSIGLEYNIQAFTECDPDDPTQAAYRLIRDIKQATFTPDPVGFPHWGRRPNGLPVVSRTLYIGRIINEPQAGTNVIDVTVRVRFEVADSLI